jgi:AraC-type DNA-binding domain-containing proteins
MNTSCFAGSTAGLAVEIAIEHHVLRPGMDVRWGIGAVAAGNVDPETTCFLFVLSSDDGDGAGRMIRVCGREIIRVCEEIGERAFLVAITVNAAVARELFREEFPLSQDDAVAAPSHWLALPPDGRLAIEAIRRCPLAGTCRALVIAARCHDLLAGYVTAAQLRATRHTRVMMDTEERLREASALLVARLDEAPSLEALAKQVGLSETTLKRGFRQVFGSTVYEYLRIARMEKARTLLQSGEATVIEAASLVGYSNPSNFAAAFRRQFGLNPKEYQLIARR